MKKFVGLLLLGFLMLSQTMFAQDKLYLVFEFMRVDGEQGSAYTETENYWEKIQQELANNGDILGWDVWYLQPGGEDQGYQYLVVTLFDDPVKMMEGASWDVLMTAAKKAYPDMSEEAITAKINHAAETRDLAVNLYLERIATTSGDFNMDISTVCSVDMMKAKTGKTDEYEKAEQKVFQPRHQKLVDAGQKGSWGLMRVILPYGSDRYASHITANMYTGYEQFFASQAYEIGEATEEETKAIQDGLQTRDLRYVYMATLLKKVRKAAE